ncbi:hypothetical protein D3C71_2009950 [compost metagenome]
MPNTIHDNTLSTVLCTSFCASRSSTNNTPVTRVSVNRLKPTAIVRNNSVSRSASGGSARSHGRKSRRRSARSCNQSMIASSAAMLSVA